MMLDSTFLILIMKRQIKSYLMSFSTDYRSRILTFSSFLWINVSIIRLDPIREAYPVCSFVNKMKIIWKRRNQDFLKLRFSLRFSAETRTKGRRFSRFTFKMTLYSSDLFRFFPSLVHFSFFCFVLFCC